MRSTVARNLALPILTTSILALFVSLLAGLGSAPAHAQDQYSDQYQYDTKSSSTAPDYTPDPPSGCFTPDPASSAYNKEAAQICLDGTEPMYPALSGWIPVYSPSTVSPDASLDNPTWVYQADVYSPGLTNTPSQSNTTQAPGWNLWFYSQEAGWVPG